ncbi:helix-turn-helix domain-containing protein [Bradyrhizobium lablabi]|uniref:winged helix-turn-helix transcriptional regulator n=1 Tax=Bradyrhizobium lablabi TaxID=722472 RepID=UPI001BAD6F9F|nr:helix-turn-helix domain-containing protein [Bradyrhizobium lablabi]MBR0692942.1 helix-turn-helix transcriptional regulator [Bradyrhizobium lablabi]
MPAGYGQFCPIAKASEVFATRWTPLILRELMSGAHSFNDIHRGVPLISRAVLVARLRQLEKQGVVERRIRVEGAGYEYWLSEAGEGFRPAVDALGRWGLSHTCDRIEPSDLDPGLLMWALRKRVKLSALPTQRIVLRFEFLGVPASRTKLKVMWLLLERSGADVCARDPGFAVDLTLRGNIRDWIALLLTQTRWRDLVGAALQIEGDRKLMTMVPAWLQFDAVSKDKLAVAS